MMGNEKVWQSMCEFRYHFLLLSDMSTIWCRPIFLQIGVVTSDI